MEKLSWQREATVCLKRHNRLKREHRTLKNKLQKLENKCVNLEIENNQLKQKISDKEILNEI